MTRFRYVVLGTGRQGTAAAYDLALRSEAREIVLADASAAQTEHVASCLMSRLPPGIEVRLTPTPVDASNSRSVLDLLDGADAAISALP